MGFTLKFDEYDYSISHLYSKVNHKKIMYGREWDSEDLIADVKHSFKVTVDQLDELIDQSKK